MRYELQSLDPFHLARICACIYGALVVAVVVIALPLFLLATLFSVLGSGIGAAELGMILAVFVLYPVVGVAMGWGIGFVTGWVYNKVVGWTGGLRLDLREVDEPPRPTPPL